MTRNRRTSLALALFALPLVAGCAAAGERRTTDASSAAFAAGSPAAEVAPLGPEGFAPPPVARSGGAPLSRRVALTPARTLDDLRRPSARTPGARRSMPLARTPDTAVRSALERRIRGIELDGETSLRVACAALQHASSVDILVAPRAEDAFADSGGEITLSLEHPVRLRSALDLVTEFAGEDIDWTVRYGVVLVSTREQVRGRPKTLVLDVRDLLWAPPSFAAPEIGVLPSGSTFTLPELPETYPWISEDGLIDASRAAVAPGTWDEDGNSSEIIDGKLFVTHD